MSVNKVILVGHLGKDPEVRILESGTKLATFSLATSESYKDRNSGERVDKTEWHNVVLWKNQADVAERFLKKGSKIYLEGKITTDSYEDKNGDKKFVTKIIGHQIVMLDAKGNSSSQQNEPVSDDPTDDLPF